MKPDFYIARRYLTARRSLGVIHLISAVSAVGMAIGAAALILILSVYNGFDRIIRDNLSDLDPDVLVTPVRGKYFVPEGAAFEALLQDGRIARISSVLEEDVVLGYGGRQALARAKGVDSVYEQESRLAEHVIDGEFLLHAGGLPRAAVGASLARKLGISPRFVEPLTLYYPRRGAQIPLAGAAAMLGSVSLSPSCLVSVSAEADESLLIVPLEQMRTLLGLQDEVSGLELHLTGKADRQTLRGLQETLGPDYRVLDRYRQHPDVYKMMRYEKLAIFLILIFVLVIIAVNIFASLTLLVIAKQEDMQTLRAMGADERLIRRIFVREGVMISLTGLAAGLAAGTGLTLLQQHFGWIKMPGGFFLEAYPVSLRSGDLLGTALCVVLIGLLVSLLAAPRSRS